MCEAQPLVESAQVTNMATDLRYKWSCPQNAGSARDLGLDRFCCRDLSLFFERGDGAHHIALAEIWGHGGAKAWPCVAHLPARGFEGVL